MKTAYDYKKWVLVAGFSVVVLAVVSSALYIVLRQRSAKKYPLHELSQDGAGDSGRFVPETFVENGTGSEPGATVRYGAALESETEFKAESEFDSETESGFSSPSENPPEYLKDLSGLIPGTILDEMQFDPDHLDQYFTAQMISEGDDIYAQISGKSYQVNRYIGLGDLRYIKLPHYNFNGQIQVGELIVNASIEQDVRHIFMELFEAKYQIQSMYLIDNYWTGDPDDTDTASIDVNNTSAFCFRNISYGAELSNHAYGRAIDLNPQQNPYVSYKTGRPVWDHENANAYIDRNTGLAHVITYEDPAFQIFQKYGFSWGGDWETIKDYQHFEK